MKLTPRPRKAVLDHLRRDSESFVDSAAVERSISCDLLELMPLLERSRLSIRVALINGPVALLRTVFLRSLTHRLLYSAALIVLTVVARAQVPSAPAGFVFCANENQTCSFGGNQDVAYGANGRFFIKTGLLGNVACDITTFGDPIPGTVKACYITPRYSTFCANENEVCTPSGMQDVAYGANGSYSFKLGVTGSLTCSSGVFGGDPAVNIVKACYTGPTYTQCTAEDQTCNVNGMQIVAFGANGQFISKNVVGSIACDDATFGDPDPEVVKACYTTSSYIECSQENQVCNFDGMHSVAFGANGSFFFKVGVTGNVGCDVATFGDPAPGSYKACYTKYEPQYVAAAVMASTTQAGVVNIFWLPVTGATSYQVYRSIRLPQGSPTVTQPSKILLTSTDSSTRTFTDTTAPLFYGITYSVIPMFGNTPSQERVGLEVRPVGDPQAKVWGFADTHTHQFANLAFGGDFYWGQPFGLENQALQSCSQAHDPQLISFINTLILLYDSFPVTPQSVIHYPSSTGFSDYASWPRWNTLVHQQMYSDWLYRAFQGGLRLMVMHAVNDEYLCSYLHSLNHLALGRSCDDMEAVDIQLNSARDLESYLNNQCTSADAPRCLAPGVGWYHIVTSAEEARRTINNGQLAVVLGMEVGRPFGCGKNDGCTATDVRNRLRHYHDDLGVRHIFPVHLIDNGFGAAQLYVSFFNDDDQAINGEWFQATECPHTASPIGGNPNAFYAFHLSDPIPGWLHVIGDVSLSNINLPPSMPSYPGATTCNANGLTDLGKFLIRELMSQHMIIDVDHMSLNSRNDTETIAETYAKNATGQVYPLIAGHTSFLGVLKDASTSENKRSEAMKTDDEIARIFNTGGMVSAGLAEVGTTAQIWQEPGAIKHDCSNSSKTWAQLYEHVINVGKNAGLTNLSVGLSSDQPLVTLIGPRYGPDACNGGNITEPSVQGLPWSYPFMTLTPGTHVPMPQSIQGTRVFDFNTDGMAHIGMYPDFIQDLRFLGMSEQDLQPLFRSAEAYIEMWEKAEQMAVLPPQIPTPRGCSSNEHCCATDAGGNCTKCLPASQSCAPPHRCPSGQQCCETDDQGNCTKCVPSNRSCP